MSQLDIEGNVIHVKMLSNDDIEGAYDQLVDEDFFATMGGWEIPKERIERLYGEKLANKYEAWLENPW